MLSRAVLSGLMTIAEALIERLQVVVGDDDGDLDEFIDREIETRHLAVDPDQDVGSSHIPSLSSGPTAIRGIPQSPRQDSNLRPDG